MAAYFEFDKRHPHIKYDDVYVKNGKVENNKLILNYSVDGLKPLEVDLSSIANLIEVDSELSSTSMNPVTNAATVAGIETAKKEAIAYAETEFAKIKNILMNAPTFTDTSTIGQMADFLNALTKPFKVS